MSATGGTSFSPRKKIGALLLDCPRLLWALYGPRAGRARWPLYGNRIDRLTANPDGRGVQCRWEYSRTLHACDVFPWTARALLRHALRDWPICMKERPDHLHADGTCSNAEGNDGSGGPEISFIIGHRGSVRLPHLLHTLRAIAAQEEVRFECIVVEQDVEPLVRGALPAWVRYLHTPTRGPEALYNRSQTFNAGARIARSRVLVLQDNDMLLPTRYAVEILRCVRRGYDVVDLKRFVFYMARQEWGRDPLALDKGGKPVARVIENLRAGGSIALTGEAFESIGRMDESFVGWGGEDVEFWQRARTRRVWDYGLLPVVHLWHPDQPSKKQAPDTPWMEHLRRRCEISPERRIEALRSAAAGGSARVEADGTGCTDGTGATWNPLQQGVA